ncbi:hypothetical protein K2173_001906 [Erythroxylum novogranatense]|uniref:HMA domain-containing protein n=1 Tax=Erythroxylum novogranatense TaxID=1862640 RepID=A0AAV8SPV2_9ROSI|nr:hypothetical protein K2173_001906 [Erythroxylum novogranatense]
MKGIDIFCASQASTAICMSMDQPSSSSSSSSTIQLGGRAIDRYNPIIRDQKRIPRSFPLPPCTSEPPINPQPYRLLNKIRKASDNTKTNDKTKRLSSKPKDQRAKKSSGDSCEDVIKSSAVAKDVVESNWSGPRDFITPPGSSRYLLSESAFFDGLQQDNGPALSLVPVESQKAQAHNRHESTASRTSSSLSDRSSTQVVVLRVSLHCKGCEGKVRKHLSKMQGVRSFTIDFAAKKVTVIGEVTPLSVLASVSKVKNAQLWSPAIPVHVSKKPEVLKT